MIHVIDNGKDSSFWLNPWLPEGKLLDRYSQREVLDLGLERSIKVGAFICQNGWVFPHAASRKITELFNEISTSVQPHSSVGDEILWKGSVDGRFSINSALNYSGYSQQSDVWTNIWFKGKINEHAICIWMALKHGLKMKDLLAARNVPCDARCVLCGNSDDSVLHLFILCSFTAQIWSSIASKFGVPIMASSSLEDRVNNFVSSCSSEKRDNITLARMPSCTCLGDLARKEQHNF